MEPNTSRKIFLVDDDVFCLNLYQQFLIKLGYENISCFTGGVDCLKNIDQHPDIVFLDYNMEDMSGLEVLKKIKEKNKEIIVVFISGQEDVDVAVQVLHNGAFDYIVKSKITPDLLHELLKKIEGTLPEKAQAPTKKSFFQSMKQKMGI